MEHARIPGTSLDISRVALGTWAIGGWMWGGTDEAESIATLRAAVEHGVDLIDTAPAYGFGRSEEIVGKALAAGNLRARVRIATKAGLEWQNGRVFRNASRVRLLREVDDSLRRLQKCIGRTRLCRSKKRPEPCGRCSSRARLARSA
jgi:aryl-alcohol dehydrogenase-like predicted oxidoreductase